MSDVAQWLEGLGLSQYAQLFADSDIRLDVLPDLTDADLRELGISLGDRKRLVRAISDMSKDVPLEQTSTSPMPEIHSSTEAERRQLTVMFCDLVGSTALSTRLDPEDYREVIRAYQDACAGVIARYDGYVAKFMGDGVLAYFGWPRGHEDDSGRAISAGLGVVEAIGDIPAASGEIEPLAVRIGIATGPVVVGDIVGEGAAQEAAVTGETPNLASRLQEFAEPNSVVIAATTHALAGGLFDYDALGGQSLKGIDGPTEVWRVLGERRVESRFAAAHTTALTPLIGREEELELLSRRWERAKGGNGQIVLISGEPGIGKSRLTRALQDWIGEEPHTSLLFQCSPHHTSSALYPTISQLELAAGFDTGDDTNARLDKLEALLQQSGRPTDNAMPLIAVLLSIPLNDRYSVAELTPQQQKDRTLATWIDQLVGLSKQQPVVFIFEDAHWIDPTSLELLELVIERITNLPVLMVVTYRPEFTAPWVGLPNVTLQALNRLTPQDCARMTERLIGERYLSPEILDQIAERTDGVPLFIEELTRSVVESGDSDSSDVADIVIPATLQDALEARFDRSPAVREVAQVGSAIGREFPYDLLSAVASLTPSELDAALDDLTGSGLIFARGAPPDASYTFKHALVQDTAYDSMVRSKRQETHKRIAKILRDLRPEVAETEPETLAHHYTAAGIFDDAVDWWTRAGQLASARSANPEALALLERGLETITALPESETRHRRELSVQTALFGPIINVIGQTSVELENAFNRTLQLCELIDAPDAMFRGLFAKSLALGNRGQHLISNEAANELVRRAESASDEGALMMGHRLAAMSSFLLGQITVAQKHADIVISQFDRAQHGQVMITYGQDPKAIAEAYISVFQFVLGRPEKSRRAWKHAIEEALALDHVGTLGPVLAWGGIHGHALRRDTEGMRQVHEYSRELTSHHKMPIWEINERVAKAMVNTMASPSAKSASELREVLMEFETFTRSPSMCFPIYWGSYLAQNYCEIGAPDQALEAIEKGLNFAEASEEHWSDSELFRMRGVALAVRDGVEENDEAESCLRRAVEDARSRHAKSLELRAATSLANFLRDQGRVNEAREELSPVFNWFTEGFDMPDLKDAKTLLGELA